MYLETSTDTQFDRSKRNVSHLLLGSMVELYDKLHQLRDESFKKYYHLIINGNHSDIDYQVKQVIDKAEIDKLDDESILTEKDLTLFHKTSHESVEISHQKANCLKHMIRGLSAKEAAKEMNISYRTMKAHLSELKRKLGCESEKELIALYHNVI